MLHNQQTFKSPQYTFVQPAKTTVVGLRMRAEAPMYYFRVTVVQAMVGRWRWGFPATGKGYRHGYRQREEAGTCVSR